MKSKKPKKKKEIPKKDDTLKIIGTFEEVIKKMVEDNPKPPENKTKQKPKGGEKYGKSKA